MTLILKILYINVHIDDKYWEKNLCLNLDATSHLFPPRFSCDLFVRCSLFYCNLLIEDVRKERKKAQAENIGNL